MPVALSGGIGVCRNIQRTAAGKFNCAKRAGDAAQLCSLRTGFHSTARPPSTRVMALTGQTTAQGASFTVVTELRRRFFFIQHHSPGAALIAGRAGDASLNRRPHKCGSRYRDVEVSNYKTILQAFLQVIVIFDENMPMKCHFRHSSTRPSPNRRNACKTGKASAHAAGLCPYQLA